MNTMTLNWVWFALVFVAAGCVLLRLRHQSGGGSDTGKGDSPRHPRGIDEQRGMPMSLPHRSHAPVIDPVTGQPVCTATAPAYFYQGRVYFFATVRNRERFEAAPRAFVQPRRGEDDTSNATIDWAGRAQPVQVRAASHGRMPTHVAGQARPDSPDGRTRNRQGARDGG
jgi:YHS domain-containing protein